MNWGLIRNFFSCAPIGELPQLVVEGGESGLLLGDAPILLGDAPLLLRHLLRQLRDGELRGRELHGGRGPVEGERRGSLGRGACGYPCLVAEGRGGGMLCEEAVVVVVMVGRVVAVGLVVVEERERELVEDVENADHDGLTHKEGGDYTV